MAEHRFFILSKIFKAKYMTLKRHYHCLLNQKNLFSTVPPKLVIKKNEESTYMPRKAGTTILFFHNGQPRSSYYAKNHLSNMLKLNFLLPLPLAEIIVNMTYLRLNSTLWKCLANAENQAPLFESLERLSVKMKESLNQVLPEFGPFNCTSCFLYDNPKIEKQFKEILRNGTDNLIIISMHPFSADYLLNPMLRKFNTLLNSHTKILMETSSNKSPQSTDIYVAKNSHTSFTCNILTDLGESESIIQYWAEIILNKFRNSQEETIDGIIFASYLPVLNKQEFINKIEKSAKRIMYTVYGVQSRAIPWRCAYYSSWDQFWSLLNFRQRINNKLKDLQKESPNSNICVIPLTNLIEDFNTQTVISSLISNMENVSLLDIGKDASTANIVSYEPLAHSLVELVKNKLLNLHNKV